MSWKTIEFWEIFDPKMASFFHVKIINTNVLKIFQTKIKFPEGLEYWQRAITYKQLPISKWLLLERSSLL